ncbi:MAG TPA: hypothetical protein VGA00_01155 [Acidiferrobacterales bacterium]|jgi:hypothetical protein
MPAGVRLVAWTWIVSGALIVLAGVSTAQLARVMTSMMGEAGLGAGGMPGLEAMAGMGAHGVWWAALQVAVGALAVIAGVYFLKLRPWARNALEALSWLSVLSVVGFGILWHRAWTALTANLQVPGVVIDPAQLQLAGWIIGAVAAIIVVVPLVLMIRYLRGSTVRRAIAGVKGSE